MIFEKESIKHMYADVAVIGGGTAGVFAAVSAAKTGAKVILVEKNSMLGGTMTVASVNFPGLFFAWGKQIISGPCWEAIERAEKLGGAVIPEISFKPKRHWYEQITLNRFVYTAVLFEMCAENGVELLCNTMLCTATENDDGVTIITVGKNQMYEIAAKTAIDATGDANLAALAGFKTVKSEVQQPATLQNHISGYCVDDVSKEEIDEKLKYADLPEYITANNLYTFLQLNKIDLHIACYDAESSEGKTALEYRTLSTMLKVYKFLKSISGLEKLEVDFIAEETGVRETVRIEGEGVITAEDYINGCFYPDSVCYAFYPIDLHVMEGIVQKFHKKNVVAKIPYSALIPKGAKRILCAGRCISSDSYANSAVRVEAVCMAVGQAAGCAAALAAQRNMNVDNVDYNVLCGALKAINAIVPENNQSS